ncbi:MAG: hypothetical protein QM784_00670 [Polyangiaceae bacterium]
MCSGSFSNPLADKLLVTALLVWMVPMGRISEWAVVLLLSRELAVTGLRSVASSEGLVIAAGEDGKSKTALQMVGILCLLIGYPYHFDLGVIDSRDGGFGPSGQNSRIHFHFSLTSAVSYASLFSATVQAKGGHGR